MSVDTASYADLLVMIAALKEENERLKPLAEIGEKWRSNSSLKEWFPYTAEELDHLKARVAELETRTQIHMTIQEIADLAVCAGINMRESEFDSDPSDEIVICQEVDLDNEDGTHTVWPLAFYWADCPEEGFTGIGDDPGAKPIKEPANEG